MMTEWHAAFKALRAKGDIRKKYPEPDDVQIRVL